MWLSTDYETFSSRLVKTIQELGYFLYSLYLVLAVLSRSSRFLYPLGTSVQGLHFLLFPAPCISRVACSKVILLFVSLHTSELDEG
jgi:hypothetical protein